ncbi:hypothetical protein M409DRAFT_61992 [Zasmidium cellare ATCC 36951]|uniref:Cytochrome P450 n=1 Tax=Zasmidium cellare ATCC 36951 TaxID=1080233 RepID=A0A6A6D3L6_ZASCE|nr:uncharacterized protein M409DRAFT_61992 [Zasmidium cellare ATCC 36951]KAF2173703.1 hypothetical protein M409DRAFT_61992 [Zasmidium cellare ATCC 36951]
MFLYILSAVLLFVATTAVYRLYFSPLSHIPGPKLAAITTWYAAYHDLIRGGQLVFVLEDLHRQYGPVVRIQPDLVHVSDPRFIDKLYTQSPKQRRERFYTVLRPLFAPGSMLAAEDHDLHQRRRAALNQFFSRSNVRRLEEDINSTLKNLFRRFDDWADAREPAALMWPFKAATKDVIQNYVFGGGDQYLNMDDCNEAFFSACGPTLLTPLGIHVHWLVSIMNSLPPKMMLAMVPRIVTFAEFVMGLGDQIDRIRESTEIPEKTTVFHELLRNESLPASEKTTKRLREEAMVIVVAGSDTTAYTLGAIVYEVLSDKTKLARLKKELATVMTSELPPASKLESLPYLNAIIPEALRLYPGAVHRQDRRAPGEDLIYHNPETDTTITIPAGTGVGMAAPIANRDRGIYGEDADEFNPDRWIDNPGIRKYLLSFSKGTRQCLGINLAYQELQTFTAGIFHKYDLYDPTKGKDGQDGPTLELYETTKADVAMHREFVTPALPEGSKGLRVVIRR